jgi:hypothetical protein
MDQEKANAFLEEYNALTVKHGLALAPSFQLMEIKSQGETKPAETTPESQSEEKPQDEANNAS